MAACARQVREMRSGIVYRRRADTSLDRPHSKLRKTTLFITKHTADSYYLFIMYSFPMTVFTNGTKKE